MSRPHDPWASDFPLPAADPRQQQRPSVPTGPVPARPDYTVAALPLQGQTAYPPWTVRAAFWTWLAGCVTGLATVAYSVSRFSALRALLSSDVRAQQPQIGAAALDKVVDTTLYLGLGGSTAIIVVQLLFAVLLLARRNWARISLAACGLLGLLWAGLSLDAVAEPGRLVLLGQAVLIVTATVLMFSPSANAWFRRRSGSPR